MSQSQPPAWKNWCRLCAKDGGSEVNVFVKDEDLFNLTEEIFKSFAVEITEFDESPKKVCKTCCKFVGEIAVYREKCTRVQSLFTELEFSEKFNGIEVDLDRMRTKFGINDVEPDVALDQPSEEINTKSNNDADEPEVEMHDLEYLEINYFDLKHVKKEEKDGNDEDVLQVITEVSVELEDDSYSVEIDEVNSDDCSDEEEETTPKRKKRRSPRKSKTLDVKYACEHCDKTFKRDQNYRSHMQTVHSIEVKAPVFPCTKCDKTFLTEKRLANHEFTHLPLDQRNTIPCPFCEKKFTKHINVKAHIKAIHINEKPFICEECGKAFKTIGALKEHKFTHVEDRPFQCSSCDKRFKNKSRLKTHEDTHNDTIYVCTTCGLQLNTRRTLRMHMLVHSDQKRHKCNYCGNEFKRAKALKNHLILHTGLKPYTCNFCDKTFANGSNCRSHKKKSHPKELAAMEAAGGKTSATNIPKLEQLRAVAGVKPSTTNQTKEDQHRDQVSNSENLIDQSQNFAHTIFETMPVVS